MRLRPALAFLPLACAGCPEPRTRGADVAASNQVTSPPEARESIYAGALQPGWQESGAAQRELSSPGPARIRFTGDWTLLHKEPLASFGALTFRVQEPPGEGEFLQVHVTTTAGRDLRSVKVDPDDCTDLGAGWTQVRIPLRELDPDGSAFDRIVFDTFRPFDAAWVLLDDVALVGAPEAVSPTAAVASAGARSATRLPSRDAKIRVRCDVPATPISPYIYGIAGSADDAERLSATARRWGGNPTSRYNWEGHFWNTALDWFFENQSAPPYETFLDDNATRRVASALTIPTLGWVAKDGTSWSFPVSAFGPQQRTDPYRADAGNGVGVSGAKLLPGPATRTSVAAPPEWAKRWVTAIVDRDGKAGRRSVYEYILDNEPMLWSATHRDVHPDPLGYDELLGRTLKYATAIRDADPDAIIAGPAEWGWSAYLYSAKDLAGGSGLHTDRLAHGDVPLVAWYLRQLRDAEQATGKRLLDVLDLHYYPQEDNVYGGGTGGSDRATQLLRLRSTRSLWDPSYVDESWIKDSIHLLPRMKEWIDRNYPGRGISIGEWNFGGEKDISGALATAEALGRFAQFGVTSAFYWTAPPAGSSSGAGFLAYRNFDGHGGRFLDFYVPTTASEGLSVFASRDAANKRIVVVAINMAPDTEIDADLDLSACGGVTPGGQYVYANGSSSFAAAPAGQSTSQQVRQALPPWSITVLDLALNGSPSQGK